ncbi:MAG: endonuclease III [Parcubacteria group bacterium Gr01-1014_33]|nr:MAG: endonuclease III [Parcubacteria group bacterium Gr01-1014_33]
MDYGNEWVLLKSLLRGIKPLRKVRDLSTMKNEVLKTKKEHTQKILRVLARTYPHAKIALRFSHHWELLVAVILSAQCTDKKVNEVTERLFKKYKTRDDYVRAPLSEFEAMIRSTGFYHAKAKNIIAAATLIKEKFGGSVPRTMEEILMLPGVARKTANVVLGNAFGIVEGIAVDTHVRRLSQRLGFSKFQNPEKIEKDLMENLPKKDWFRATSLLVDHGRAICTAKDPRCDLCPLAKLCPSAFQFPRFAAHAALPSRKKDNRPTA